MMGSSACRGEDSSPGQNFPLYFEAYQKEKDGHQTIIDPQE